MKIKIKSPTKIKFQVKKKLAHLQKTMIQAAVVKIFQILRQTKQRK